MSLERFRSKRIGYEHEIFEESHLARELVRGGPDDYLMISEASRAVREDGLRRMYLEHERAIYRRARIETPWGEYKVDETTIVKKRVVAEKDP